MIESSTPSGTWSPARSAREITKSVLEATYTQANNISFIYRETLQAVKALFSGMKYYNADDTIVDVKCIHGNPERTIAMLKKDNNIILPVVSVVQTTSESADDRRRPQQMLLEKKVWSTTRQRAFRVVGLAPKAVNILYDVNIWTKYRSDLDQLTEQMHLKFHPAIKVVTTYNDETLGFLTQESDQSSVDLGDKEDRILRRSFSFSVQTYIPTPQFLLTSTGKLEKFNTEAELVEYISKI